MLGDEVIGVWILRSDEVNAFDDIDIFTVQTIADQLAWRYRIPVLPAKRGNWQLLPNETGWRGRFMIHLPRGLPASSCSSKPRTGDGDR
jgi:hypothetical protein